MKKIITVKGDGHQAEKMVVFMRIAQDKHLLEYPEAYYKIEDEFGQADGVYTFFQIENFGEFDTNKLIDLAKEKMDLVGEGYDEVSFYEEDDDESDSWSRENDNNNTEWFSIEETRFDYLVYSDAHEGVVKSYNKRRYTREEVADNYTRYGADED